MTKIIFFDIDGTLVSFRTHAIPPSAIEAVRRIRQKGVKVWIATGRPIPFIDHLEGLEYDGIMCVNGAYCLTRDGKALRYNPVPKSDVLRMIEEQKRSGMAVCYAGVDRAILTAPKGIPDDVGSVFSLLDIKQPDIYEPDEALAFDVMQVIAFFRHEQTVHITSEVLMGCNVLRWHPLFTDCVAKGTDKAAGIEAVIRHYGFDISETMAFGDGGNDIPMLRLAGIGVAMGNASQEVKDVADIVTSSVDDNGVANVLDRLNGVFYES